jgi:hypothetical protein
LIQRAEPHLEFGAEHFHGHALEVGAQAEFFTIASTFFHYRLDVAVQADFLKQRLESSLQF